jgi:hypothetical protein
VNEPSLKLPPGQYRVLVTQEKPALTVEDRFEIRTGLTNSISLMLAFNRSLEIQTDPPGALVEGTAFSGPFKLAAPLTKGFNSGSIRFKLTAPGCFPLETNFAFNPARMTSVNFSLTRSSHPLEEEDWTNTLGMVFRWMGRNNAGGLWVCSTETRLSEFRRFVESVSNSWKGGIHSLGPEGYALRTNCSWQTPGFIQSTNHPVVGVNWHDAHAFCQWLTRVELATNRLAANQIYRLPLNAEWREWTKDLNWRTEQHLPKLGNLAGSEVTNAWPAGWDHLAHSDRYPRTSPVACDAFLPCKGLYDLVGNAAEWSEEKALLGAAWLHGRSVDDMTSLVHGTISNQLRGRAVQAEQRLDISGFRVVIEQRGR